MLKKIRYRLDPIGCMRSEGVKIGRRCRLVGRVSFGSEPYLVTIGDHVSVTDSSFITHDGGVWVMRDDHPQIDVISPISIGSNVFIGAKCILMPGVSIGDDVVIGAGSIVTKDLASGGVYAGVPARKIKCINEYKSQMLRRGIASKGLSSKEKRELIEFNCYKNERKF